MFCVLSTYSLLAAHHMFASAQLHCCFRLPTMHVLHPTCQHIGYRILSYHFVQPSVHRAIASSRRFLRLLHAKQESIYLLTDRFPSSTVENSRWPLNKSRIEPIGTDGPKLLAQPWTITNFKAAAYPWIWKLSTYILKT